MHIAYGSTRVVLLTKNHAIKIGRLRPLRLIFRLLFLLPFSKKRRTHFFKKYGPYFLKAVIQDLCAGLYANRGEYEYYQRSKDSRVMPTTASFLGGWIVLQPRGTPASLTDVAKWCPLLRYQMRGPDADEPKQYAHLPCGDLVLVDYGLPETRKALSAMR